MLLLDVLASLMSPSAVKDEGMLDSLRGLEPLTLHHHSPVQSRLDPQLVQDFIFEGIEVGGLALDAPHSSPLYPHTRPPVACLYPSLLHHSLSRSTFDPQPV